MDCNPRRQPNFLLENTLVTHHHFAKFYLPNCFLIENTKQRHPHPSSSLRHHLNKFPPLLEIVTQHQTGGLPDDTSPNSKHHTVAEERLVELRGEGVEEAGEGED